MQKFAPFPISLLSGSHRVLAVLDHKQCFTRSQLNQIHSQLIVSATIADFFFSEKFIALCAISDMKHTQSILGLNSKISIWNTAIRALCEDHQSQNALLMCKEMVKNKTFPDNYTFSYVFKACSDISGVVSGLMYHTLVIKLGWELYDYVQNGLVHCYSSRRCMEYARKVFDCSPVKDIVTWTAVINGYLKIGELDSARYLFDKMPERKIVSWSAMINGYARLGKFTEALEMFNAMLAAGIKPNISSIMGALSACSSLCALDKGKWLHMYIDSNKIRLDDVLLTALVGMYAKCGCIETSCQLFEKMTRKDVVSYSALISGLADNGKSSVALELFQKMEVEGVRPNDVAYLCALSACSRIGAVEEGLRIFTRMKKIHGIIPAAKHYGCLVDLLGKAGFLEEAENVIRRMSIETDQYLLGALLNACRVHGNFSFSKVIVETFANRKIDHSGVHILVSNIYASLKKLDDVEKVRMGMEEKNVKKVTGCSTVEICG